MKNKIIGAIIFMIALSFLYPYLKYSQEVLNCTFNDSAPCEVGTGGWLVFTNK